MPNHEQHCDHHFALVQQLNELRDSQEDFQEHQKTWMRNLDERLDKFTDEMDQDIRGGRGPEGKPGMKQIMHDNKHAIVEIRTKLDKREINWPQLLLGALVSIIVVVAAAVLVYLLLPNGGGG